MNKDCHCTPKNRCAKLATRFHRIEKSYMFHIESVTEFITVWTYLKDEYDATDWRHRKKIVDGGYEYYGYHDKGTEDTYISALVESYKYMTKRIGKCYIFLQRQVYSRWKVSCMSDDKLISGKKRYDLLMEKVKRHPDLDLTEISHIDMFIQNNI